MKKTYKIEVDCANCANKMEDAAKNTAGVQNATVNFMTQKMIVEFEEGQDAKRNYQICIIFDSISDRWLRYFEESMEGNLKPSGI